MLAGDERDRESTVDLAAKRRETELRAHVGRELETKLARVGLELIASAIDDGTGEGQIAARAVRPDLARRHASELDVAADRLHLHRGGGALEGDITRERVDRGVTAHALHVHVA